MATAYPWLAQWHAIADLKRGADGTSSQRNGHLRLGRRVQPTESLDDLVRALHDTIQPSHAVKDPMISNA